MKKRIKIKLKRRYAIADVCGTETPSGRVMRTSVQTRYVTFLRIVSRSSRPPRLVNKFGVKGHLSSCMHGEFCGDILRRRFRACKTYGAFPFPRGLSTDHSHGYEHLNLLTSFLTLTLTRNYYYQSGQKYTNSLHEQNIKQNPR